MFIRFRIIFYYIVAASLFRIDFVKAVPGITLNVGDQLSGLIYKIVDCFGNACLYTYVVDVDEVVTKVMDSGSKVWEAEEKENLLQLKLYNFYGINRLAKIDFESSGYRSCFYEKRGDSWIEVSRYNFNELIRKYTKNRRLDLSEIDEGSFHVQDPGLEGLPSKIYVTKEQYELTLVLDDFDIIWQSPDDNHICTCVVVHGADGDPRAVNLHIMGEFTQVQEFHFKINGNWEPVTKRCFYSMLKEIDDEIDKSKSQDVETNTGQDLTFY